MLASIVFIFNEKNELLLIKRHPEDRWMPNKWGVVGGKAENGENPIETAIREVFEETGLRLGKDSLFFFQHKGTASYFIVDRVFGDVALSFEHTEFCWVPRGDVWTFDLVPGIKEMVEKMFLPISK